MRFGRYLGLWVGIFFGALVLLNRTAEAASGPNAGNVLDFEANSGWFLSEGQGVVSYVADDTSGVSAVQVDGLYWRRIQSAPLSGVVATSNGLRLDVKPISPVADWHAVGLVVSIPSKGLHWVDLGQRSLDGLPTDRYSTLSFVLPEHVRQAINEQDYDDLRLHVSVNSEGPVLIDDLSLGVESSSGPPTMPGGTPPVSADSSEYLWQALTPFVPGPYGADCEDTPLEVVDMQSDFREIWLELEEKETGKRTERRPTVALEFSEPVPASSIGAYFIPLQDGCGHQVRAGTPLTSDAWQHTTNGPSGALVPGQFNAFILESIFGTQDSQGPIAAGGGVTLSSFSVNSVGVSGPGMVAGGQVMLSSGTVHGDVQAQQADLAGNVNVVDGTVASRANEIDFHAAFSALRDLSAHIGTFLETGEVENSWGSLTLRGTDPELNVFRLSASELQVATSLTIEVPTTSGVIINVDGADLVLESMGISLAGAAPERVLWNALNARAVEVRSIGLQGSFLAPYAAVQFDNGHMQGTLIARSLSGAGALRYHPLDSELLFGPAPNSSSAALVAQRPLSVDCEYAFYLRSAGGADACLVDALDVRLLTAPAEGSRARRELSTRRLNESTGSVGYLEPKSGIYVTPEQAIDRYVSGAISQEFSQEGNATTAPLGGTHQRMFLRQHRDGLSIRNAGYSFEVDGDRVVRMMGRAVVQQSSVQSTPAFSASEAVSKTLNHLGVSSRPWDDSTTTYLAPTVSKTFEVLGEHSELRLVYEIDLRDSGVPGVVSARLDASNGKVLSVGPSEIYELPPESEFVSQELHDLDTLSVHGTVSIPVSVYQNEVAYLATPPQSPPPNSNFVETILEDRRAGGQPPYPRESIFDRNDDLVWDPLDEEGWEAAREYWSALETLEFLEDPGLEMQGIPWTGPTGLGPHMVNLIYRWDEQDAYNASFSRSWDPLNPDSRIELAVDDSASAQPFDVDSVSHELGHAVLWATRARSNLPQLDYERESGAADEGFADLVAAYTIANEFPADSEFWLIGSRDLRNPFLTSNPFWYEGIGYLVEPGSCDPVDNDYCHVHVNSTILSHWGMLLSLGTTETPQCGLDVSPIAGSTAEGQQRVLQLLIDALQVVDRDAKFADFRDATYRFARVRYKQSPEVARQVARAWYAVGLGYANNPVPLDGEGNVNAWPTVFSWSGLGHAEWTVRIATDEYFTDVVATLETSDPPGTDGKVSVWTELEPNTEYFWQVFPVSDPNDDLWESCNLGTWSFKTGSKNVELAVPAVPEEDGTYLLDEYGEFAWHTVDGATSYELWVADDSDSNGCSGEPDALADPTSSSSVSAYLGDSFDHDYNITSPEGDPVDKLVVRENAEPQKNYWVYIRANFADTQGECSEFKVRKAKLGSFARIGPFLPKDKVDNKEVGIEVRFDWTSANTLAPNDAEEAEVLAHYGRPSEGFRFTQSEGATAYKLIVYAEDESNREVPIYEATRSPGSCGLQKENGVFEWTFGECFIEGEPTFRVWARSTLLRWDVIAINEDSTLREPRCSGTCRLAATQRESDRADRFYYQVRDVEPLANVQEYCSNCYQKSPDVWFDVDYFVWQDVSVPWRGVFSDPYEEEDVLVVGGISKTGLVYEYVLEKPLVHQGDVQSGVIRIPEQPGVIEGMGVDVYEVEEGGTTYLLSRQVLDGSEPHEIQIGAMINTEEIIVALVPFGDVAAEYVTVLRFDVEWLPSDFEDPNVPGEGDDGEDGEGDEEGQNAAPLCWDDPPLVQPPLFTLPPSAYELGTLKEGEVSIDRCIEGAEECESGTYDFKLPLIVDHRPLKALREAGELIPQEGGINASARTGGVQVKYYKFIYGEYNHPLQEKSGFFIGDAVLPRFWPTAQGFVDDGYEYSWVAAIPVDHCGQLGEVQRESFGLVAYKKPEELP